MRQLNYRKDKKDIGILLSPKKLAGAFFDETTQKAAEICNQVFKEGIKAVLAYTREFDGVDLTQRELLVKKEEIKSAYRVLDKDFINALKMAGQNIERFHRRQRFRKKDWFKKKKGSLLGEKYTPLERV